MRITGFFFLRSALVNFVLSGAFIIENGGTLGNCLYKGNGAESVWAELLKYISNERKAMKKDLIF